jgi:hypothetical protein
VDRGRYRIKVIGMSNLPTDGPAILATNCERFDDFLHVLGSTDRFTQLIVPGRVPGGLLGYLAKRTDLVFLAADAPLVAWNRACEEAARVLDRGNLVAVTTDTIHPLADELLDQLRKRVSAVVLPVYCGTLPGANGQPSGALPVRVVIGQPTPPEATAGDIRRSIDRLGEWVRQTELDGAAPSTAAIPGASAASPTGPGSGPPPSP